MNMKHSFFRRLFVLIIGMAVILPRCVLAQSQQTLPPHIWGAVSNGLCAGVRVRQSDWHINDFECDIDVRNMTTNRLYVFLPPLEQRYEIELLGPDGHRIRQLKPLFFGQKSIVDRMRWRDREPFGQEPSLDERNSVNWFFLKDIFDIRTNGQFTLIASIRVNAFTNFGIGQAQMRSKPSYFLLPPVTNTFNILPSNELNSTRQP